MTYFPRFDFKVDTTQIEQDLSSVPITKEYFDKELKSIEELNKQIAKDLKFTWYMLLIAIICSISMFVGILITCLKGFI